MSPDTLGRCGEAFEGRARCGCILKADCDTDRNHMFCFDGKLRNRPCKMKNQISISARIGIALKIQAKCRY